MSVRIITGDCRDVLPTLPADSFDCIIADPPYGETSLAWDRWPDGWPTAVRRVLRPSGSMWVFGSMRMFMERAEEFVGWRIAQDVVWEKHNGSGFFNDRFRRVHEASVQFYRDDARWGDVYKCPQFTNDARARVVRRKDRPAQWTGARGPSCYVSEDGGPRLKRSVISVRSEHGRAEHPTQKPIGIVEPLLAYACRPGGEVLDPFGGSGTTAIAAKLFGAQATLVEVSPDYVSLAERRLANDAPLFSQAG